MDIIYTQATPAYYSWIDFEKNKNIKTKRTIHIYNLNEQLAHNNIKIK